MLGQFDHSKLVRLKEQKYRLIMIQEIIRVLVKQADPLGMKLYFLEILALVLLRGFQL